MSRRKFTSEFKFKVVVEALSERYSIQEQGRKYEIHPTQITTWKSQFLKNGQAVFDRPVKDAKSEVQEKEERMLKTIGQQKMEIDFFKESLVMKESAKERRRHIDKANGLSVVRQCELLEIHRSGLYYAPRGESELNLELMRLIDEEHMLHPWMGVPRITTWLKEDRAIPVNKKRIERLFRLMGIAATGPKPNTSKKGKGALHKVFAYLLKNLKIDRPNQVWAMDITYIPVKGGYLYLCAIIDLYSRFVVGWSLSNTMTSEWCRRTLETAMQENGKPEILNTDQGGQFTAHEFCNWAIAPEQGIRLSMDGKGRAIDNVFIERLWRSAKHEHVYLFPADDGLECYRGLREYFEYYNNHRRHQSLQDQTPLTVYQHCKKKAA